ncbi:MAG TPA: hypothetical protein VK105_18385 [Virgibacillus sp.]|nr:hypothetical protein [Virgibacillus sp.]HLR69055.1 hypothetical protein [Virgibacillus sp.]
MSNKKIVIDGFELNDAYIKMLLEELKQEGVKTIKDLENYFKDHWYTKDCLSKAIYYYPDMPTKEILLFLLMSDNLDLQ